MPMMLSFSGSSLDVTALHVGFGLCEIAVDLDQYIADDVRRSFKPFQERQALFEQVGHIACEKPRVIVCSFRPEAFAP